MNAESYDVDEDEGSLIVCVLLTSPVRTVVDVIVMLTSGSAEQGMPSINVFILSEFS